jgi:hypothetical protein
MSTADNYPLVIRRVDSEFLIEAPALGLVRNGSDLRAVEAEMRHAVGEILAVCDRHRATVAVLDHRAASAADRTAAPEKDRYYDTIKRAMITLLVIVIIGMPIVWVMQTVTRITTLNWPQLNAAKVASTASTGIHRTADILESITPERRDQLSRDFGRIARSLEPYVAELRPLWLPADARAREPRP